MKLLLQLILVVLILGIVYTAKSNEDIDFDIYHTTDELNDQLEKIKKNCSIPMEFNQLHKNPDLRVVTLNKEQFKSHQGFLLFGEHPREMISAETGLHLVKQLCKNESDLTKSITDNYTLQIMVNANPSSRARVEQGEYCLRENENGVDINRNYDSHWEYNDDDLRQVNSGEEPFSEIQTQTIRDLLTKQQPDYFVTVHSGTLGLFTPYGYSEEIPERNGQEMFDIMSQINDEYCIECSVGAAGKAVGYLCPGTSLDYVYENLETPYAFAMEIYESSVDVEEELNAINGSSYSQINQKQKQQQRYLRNSSSFAQTQSNDFNLFESEYERCFCNFNPQGEEHYNFVVQNWTDAILKSMALTSEKLKK